MNTKQTERQTSEHEAAVVICDVRLSDIPQIISIDEEITGVAKPELWYSYLPPAGLSQQRWFLVARDGSRVAGYILGEVRAWEFGSPPCGWILAVGVTSRHRLAGIGTRLFDEMLDRLRPTGVKTVRTMVNIDEHMLMSFFRSKGMTAGPFVELEATMEFLSERDDSCVSAPSPRSSGS